MELLDNLALGFQVALTISNLTYCFIGVLLGTAIGVLPGVGPLVTIAVLLPLTFGLPPEGAMIMLAGIYYGAAYGGSTTAILVNLPGESSSAVTCLDGYKMAMQGRAGSALAVAAFSSVIAGCIGTVLIALFAPPLTALALRFGAPEFFSLIVMALISTAALLRGSLLKGSATALAGVLIGLIGIDINSGVARFSFGIPELAEGIEFVVVAVGLFAIAEIVRNLGSPEDRTVSKTQIHGLLPSRAEFVQFLPAALRGTAVGSFFGLLPGAGQTISAFGAYAIEKQLSRTPGRFGEGAVEGVAAPEAANNAAAQTSFIPTLTLGVPGTPTMALMLGALMIQGITPGPQVISEYPSLFWGLIASMWIGNILLVILNLPLIHIWVLMLRVPYRWMYPIILAFSVTGIYTLNNSTFDIMMIAVFGVLGYLFIKLECEPAPFILGLLLGPMLEENFRRSMRLSRGDPSIFISHPISACFLAIALGVLILMILPAVRKKKPAFVEP